MKFELKRPYINAEPKTYGIYLTEHPDMLPQEGVPLETEGYVITATDYGTATFTRLPFKNGDWVDKDFIEGNFIQVK